MGIARTQATGGVLLPELLEWSSSSPDDATFLREDLLGSAAHATMLGKTAIIEAADARALRGALVALYRDANTFSIVGEEDVHMAVEAHLSATLGATGARLHAARSRNDQVALDLRLYVRRVSSERAIEACALASALLDRAKRERDVVLPAYTHRQRAQPVSAAFVIAAWAAQLVRAIETMIFAQDRSNELALGSGACSGTSLPIDRKLVARLLGFPRVTLNALDTVGDRDFALDYTWACARVLLALGKLSADIVDWSTIEHGLVQLDGEIAAGSSMMPQKKNPDMFELVRAKSARGVANVVELLTLVKGLPSGYNRDQQDDRRATLTSAPLVHGALDVVERCLPHFTFDRARGEAALADGFTQATDLAEALVRKGVPFRDAYKATGELVRAAVDSKIPLTKMTLEAARAIHAGFDAATLGVLDPRRAVSAKESEGGTGPKSVDAQLEALAGRVADLEHRARGVPSLDAIATTIEEEKL